MTLLWSIYFITLKNVQDGLYRAHETVVAFHHDKVCFDPWCRFYCFNTEIVGQVGRGYETS